ncbi:PepSY domain-containing protein [Bradyrhizobium oligotrophicum]|uniref:PepSY domain-containing protein n=1 Tax=Bradyrhizobium oligotrophicum TaxID=44255 RepID=UPI003EC0BBD7
MLARQFHRWLGLIAGPFLVVLAVTGFMLAIDAIAEQRARPAEAPAGLSVAEFTASLARHGSLERLVVTPAGAIVAQFTAPRRRAVVDPADGSLHPVVEAGDPIRMATEVHRSLMLGGPGRVILALGTAAGLLLTATGLLRLRRGERGDGTVRRLHRRLGLVFALPIAVSAATGLGLAAVAVFPLEVDGVRPAFPAMLTEGDRLPVAAVEALRAVAVRDLEELVLPRPDDPEDGYFLATADAYAWIDPVDGRIAATRQRPAVHRLATAMLRIHAGRGVMATAVPLGLGAVAVVALGLTGLSLVDGVFRRRRHVVSGSSIEADTIILVGSQRGTTWSFAERLAAQLVELGHSVDLAAMNSLASAYPNAARLLVLTATHGVGEAPVSAARFLDRLPHAKLPPAFAVLGFGERDAVAFCGFAEAVHTVLAAAGASPILPLHRIHRRSETDYAAWVERLLVALGTKAISG